jgi:hypothetical protein
MILDMGHERPPRRADYASAGICFLGCPRDERISKDRAAHPMTALPDIGIVGAQLGFGCLSRIENGYEEKGVVPRGGIEPPTP